jgi:hypothetical protein
MIKGQALRPNFLTESLVKPEVENESLIQDEEKHLYALSKHAGWKVLNDFIESELRTLEDANSTAISSGMSFEQLGYNSVVMDQVKKIVNRIRMRVQDAVEAIEKTDENK